MTSYYDNTQLSAYKDCPRKYYLRHVRHWRSEGISLDLVFGLAWHDAMDIVWQLANESCTPDEILPLAYAQFSETWLEEGGPDMEEIDLASASPKLQVKNPGNASEMLYHYIDQRWDFLNTIELLAVERPFMVPLYEDRDDIQYIGRRDKDFRYEGRVIVGEHKTTGSYKKGGPFRDDYIASYSPNSQVDGYLFASHMTYGNEAKGVWVDAALCHKTVHNGFKFIPVDRAIEQLDAWLSETREWIDRIENEKHHYINYSNLDRSYLDCFPKNTGACSMYSGCSYQDICRFIANPARETSPPAGFIEEEWKPFEILAWPIWLPMNCQ